MAVITELGSRRGVRYQAKVRRKQYQLSRTFSAKRDAESWCRRVEAAIDISGPDKPFNRQDWLGDDYEKLLRKAKIKLQTPLPDLVPHPHPQWSLSRALKEYEATVTSLKRGAAQESKRIKQWQGHPLAARPLNELTRDEIQDHVAARTRAGLAAPTIRNEVMLLSALYRHAIEIWRLKLDNPVKHVDLPSLPQGRKARLDDGHGEMLADDRRLFDACREVGGEVLALLAELAIETAMRQGELLQLTATHVKKRGDTTTLELGKSKNNDARCVVCSDRAVDILKLRVTQSLEGRLFPYSPDTLRHQFKKARDKAGLPSFHFHDLRHEGISRMAGRGLTIGELQAQSGHRTAQVLLRYVNARPDDIRGKLG